MNIKDFLERLKQEQWHAEELVSQSVANGDFQQAYEQSVIADAIRDLQDELKKELESNE